MEVSGDCVHSDVSTVEVEDCRQTDANESQQQNDTEVPTLEALTCEQTDHSNAAAVETEDTPVASVEGKEALTSGVSDIEIKLNSLRITEKWGESVGVFDESGNSKRVLLLSQVNNYFKLTLESVQSDYSVYFALISPRYPRFLRSTPHYNQRWRMRYNIFVGDVFEGKSEAVLHMGEIHLYFDIVSKFAHPYYVNSSLYRNKNAISEANDVQDLDKIVSEIEATLNDIRFSKDLHQLKFPINKELFSNCNSIFDKFMERQTEFDEEALNIHQKHLEKLKKFGPNWRRGRHGYRRQRPYKRSEGNQSDKNVDNDNDVMFEDANERRKRDNPLRTRSESRYYPNISNNKYLGGKQNRSQKNSYRGNSFRENKNSLLKSGDYREANDESSYRDGGRSRRNSSRKDSYKRGNGLDWQSRAGGEYNADRSDRYDRYERIQSLNGDNVPRYALDGGNTRNASYRQYNRTTHYRRNSFVKD